MDSRFHLGQGFSISQQEKDDFQVIDQWIPMTPHRPIPVRPNSMSINRIGSQFDTGNWQEQFQCPVGYMQEMLSYSNVPQHSGQIDRFGRNVSFTDSSLINQMSGPYTELLLNERFPSDPLITDFGMMNNNTAPTVYPIPNRTLNGMISMAERSTVPNLKTPVDSKGMFFAHQAHCSSLNLLSGYSGLYQVPQDGFPVPYNNSYNLNSASTVTNAANIDQAKRLEKELSELINFPQGNSLTKEMDKQDPSVVSLEVSNPHNTNEHLQNIVDSSSAVIQPPFEEPKDSCQGNDQVIDLNKTPEQKTPKRRKHRPKVVVEGKPKRTPKAATSKVADPKENTTTQKRKYVRKNLQESATQNPDSIRETPDSKDKQKVKRKYVRKKSMNAETQHTDCISETTNPSAKTAGSSCRRALKFETENACSQRERDLVIEQEMLQKREESFNLNTGFQVAESFNQSNMMSKPSSDLPASHHNGTLLVAQQSEVRKLASFMDQLSNNQSRSERREDLLQSSSRKDAQMDHLNSSGRDIDVRMLQHAQTEGIGSILFPAQTNFRRLENNKQIISPISESVTQILESAEAKGYRREYHHKPTWDSTENPLDRLLCMKSQVSGAAQPENHKKQKIEHVNQNNINGMSAPVAAVNQSKGEENSYALNSSASSLQRNRKLFKSYFEELLMQQKWAETSSGTEKMVVTYNMIPPTPLKMIPQLGERQQTQSCYIDASKGQAMASTQNYNLTPPTPPKIAPQPGERQSRNCNIDGSKGQAVALTPSLAFPSRKGKIPEKDMDFLKDKQSLAKRKVGRPAKQKFPITIEEIIYKMEQLSINQSINETALVPYKGDGVLIPYEGLDFIKKRKPRPKVDLDPETERVWKLLMWKEEGENLEDSDKNKQRWDEERRVFRGRADSFIARMHLVQGDRRFSKWKGSVVDSVIGVFLTQNVSDHLSSSAFMHLVAKYPSRSMREKNSEEGPTILIQEPDTCLMNQSQSIWPEKLLGPLHNQSFKMPHNLREHQRYETSWTERSIVESRHSPQEEILSSQDSVDSSVVQSNRRVGSNSGSNSEVEDPANMCKHNNHHGTSRNIAQMNSNTSSEDLLGYVCTGSVFHEESRQFHQQPEIIKDRQQLLGLNLNVASTSYQENCSNNPQLRIQATPSSNSQLYISPESGVLEVESSQLYREECTSRWPASASKIINVKDANCTSNRVLEGVEHTAPRPQKCRSKQYQESSALGPHVSLNKQLICEETCHGSQLHGMNQSLQLDYKSISKPPNLSDGQGGRQEASNIPKLAAKLLDVEDRTASVNKERTDLKNNFIESNSKDAVNSGSKTNSNANSSKASKEKTGNGRKDAVDWEGLRRLVLANGKRKERNADAMDSLDYEAMRNASVDEISDIIKERGMNNMLAGRIKEFLDRLVRDHGSTDLEWLRDVPPQKAKDYLLSIRGLGLKSVECVRLLTLHHVAFPVDTNVGRIAVRLGWVPLQPLPESLQLHLLELYPILESIQKYLWPRLCELDQLTLYELHYQLITFGKVFCTKSRPNCNACPLRAECRHFASAFTSARLALPGPEEKSIVTTNVPMTTEGGPAIDVPLKTERSVGVVIDPLLLPPAEETTEKRGLDIVSCAPIIEEPATPEQQHSEVIESEIEDMFDEDDEIPTIKLNMNELTANLQNYMQANMELQECDMSKALVALNPEAASIPAPKLKNVSRLRTEHQVYELPDSHPLLEGMDKREADDPSPYLLAIWTPGETANSVQPPEQNCQFQRSGNLCNETTCFSCNSIREANSQTVRGTLLIPCRTAMRGSFPLNGTYFQVNEMFADHESSINPIDVPRSWIWNLPRRTVYFGTSVTAIFRGLSTEGIQYCFWKGFVCVRGFEQKTRAPRPLMARLHFPASKLTRTKNET